MTAAGSDARKTPSLRCQLLGFAFLAQQFEGALGLLIGLRNLFLHFGRSFFQLRRQAHVAIVFHAGAGRNKPADDDVLLEPAQVIDRALNRSFGEHARGLLEGGGRDEAIGGERGLGNSQEQRTAGSRFAAQGDYALVLFAEVELIRLLFQQEGGVAHVLDFDPAHHLAHDDFNVLVADGHALQPVNFLDLVHQIALQLLLAQHGKNIVRVERAIHQRLAGAHALAFLHVDVNSARHRVLFFRAGIGDDEDLTLSFGDLAELYRAINFADDRGLARLAGLKQFDYTRQTAGDVFGLGG